MSDECEVTGFSPKQVARWPLVHKHLCGTLELPDIASVSEEVMLNMGEGIEAMLKSEGPTSKQLKAREGLFQHLKRTLERRFKNSELQQFGSSQSGLTLQAGDLDLCLQFKGKPPAKALRDVNRLLKQHDMEDIVMLPRAKVPIIKFKDERTKIPVDICINNTLALHNTELLKRYSACDDRVRSIILAVKHWALRRDVCDAASGTFSSYAWTLLAVQALQQTNPPVAPVLQAGQERTLMEVDGTTYDLTMSDVGEMEIKDKNNQSLGELFVEFIFRYAASWPFKNNVISVRTGATLTRKSKGWKHATPVASKAILMDRKTRLGQHSLPIEDPFDLKHDLSRVLRPAGAMDIQEEFLRACIALGSGERWNLIVEAKHPERFVPVEEFDLFADLRGKTSEEVAALVKENAAAIEGLDERMTALIEERQSNVRMSKALRGTIEDTTDLRNELRTIVRTLRPRSKQMDELQKKRDDINKRIGLPLYRIEELLNDVYAQLTGEIDLFQVPSLRREEDQFAWFFELQAMHKEAQKAQETHQAFIALLKEQKTAIKSLKVNEKEQQKHRAELVESEPMLKDTDLNFSDAMQFDKKAHKLLKVIDQRRTELRRLRREKGRLEAWVRISSNPSRGNNRDGNRGGNRGDNRGGGKKRTKSGSADWKPRNNGPRPEDVQQRAASGGTLSLTDLDVLLNSGGLSSMNKKQPTAKSSRRQDRKKKINARNLTPHRGERSQSKKGKKE
jgi:DNA polymerase sigma